MKSTTKYPPYELQELRTIIHEPWEVADQPYRLHASYAIQALFETLYNEEDEEEETPDRYDNYWGNTIPKNTIDRLVRDIAEDFNDAAANYKPIRIKSRRYTIRKVNAYDRNRLTQIFNFPSVGDDYLIVPEGVMNLENSLGTVIDNHVINQEQSKKNRNYLRQIIKLAEDDESAGWDRLTDIEILIYCWAAYYNKHQTDNLKEFKNLYKDYIYVSDFDIKACLNEKSALREKPCGMYAFSYDRVKEWHKARGIVSEAEKIPIKEAEDYWYQVALQNTFKPLDH